MTNEEKCADAIVDEKNFKRVLWEYAFKKYGKGVEEFYEKFFDEFPYDFDGLDGELHFKNFVDWLIIEKALPDTGKTIVEEFIDEHPELDVEMKQKLSRMKNVVNSEFVVLSKDGLSLKIKDRKSDKLYKVLLYSTNPAVGINTLIRGRIHPFGESYRFAGAFMSYNSPMILDPGILMDFYNQKRIKEAESIILSANTELGAILNKYPVQWVNGICNAFSIDASGRKGDKTKKIMEHLNAHLPSILTGLSEKSRSALRRVLSKGGVVKYGELKEYDDEIPFWWDNEPPTSTIGVLRLNGLLAVGRMPGGGRLYTVALIPKYIRESLKKCAL